MKIKFVLLLITLIKVNTCSKSRIDRTTEIFSDYLNQQFKIQIPDELHYFVLIPRLVCKGCAEMTLRDLNTLINKDNRNKFTFISTNNEIIPNELKSKINLLHDDSGKLDNLNLEIANVTLVETLNHKVNFVKPFYLDEKIPISKIIK